MEPDLLTEKELTLVLVSCDGGEITGKDMFSNRKKAPQDRWEFNKRLTTLAQQMIFAQDRKSVV